MIDSRKQVQFEGNLCEKISGLQFSSEKTKLTHVKSKIVCIIQKKKKKEKFQAPIQSKKMVKIGLI